VLPTLRKQGSPLAALLGGTPAIDGVPAAIAADATARGALDFAVA